MKIAFIVSTVEPGIDGIADNTNRLSGYCREHGIECRIFPFGKWKTPFDHRAYNALLTGLKADLSDYQPNIISWQYDGNLFSPRRIYMPSVVPDFSGITPLIHLMVHETWEGSSFDSYLAKRVKGFLQKQSLAGFLKAVKPTMIHTSIGLYESHLRKLGAKARLLPIISNIPRCNGVAAPVDHDSSDWNFVFFGGVYGPLREGELMEKLSKTGKNLIFHHVGRIPDRTAWQSFRSRFATSARFVEHGPLPVVELSALLQRCDFAISTVPSVLIGKSSVFHAFREHGLPVINLRSKQFHRGYNDNEQEITRSLVDLEHLPGILANVPRQSFNSLEITGREFVNAMEDLSKLACSTKHS